MSRYEKITARFVTEDGRIVTRTFLVRINRETPNRIVATQVDKFGDEVGGERASMHLIVFNPSDVSKRVPMKMNLKYAELEPA